MNSDGLPVKLRPEQERAVAEIEDVLSKHDTAVLLAPPAAGKSVVSVTVASRMDLRTLVMTPNKRLQAQYADPPTRLPFAVGRNNHACIVVDGATAAHGPCRWGYECPERHGACAYFSERDSAIAAPIAVANFSLVLADPEGWLLRDRGLMVIDECHDLEASAARQLAIDVDVEMATHAVSGLEAPPAETTVTAYREWALRVEPIVSSYADHYQGRVEARGENVPRRGLEYVRRIVDLANAVRRLRSIDDTWVPKASDRTTEQPKVVTFMPTNVAPLLMDSLWSEETKRLLMSGSVGDADALAKTLGLEDYGVVTMPCTIPAQRRPIIYWPQADVTRKNYSLSVMPLSETINSLMAEHEGFRGIVHTVNSDLAADLVRILSGFPFNRTGLFSHRTENRAEVFAAFRIASPPAVLVSPSVDVGEDFADDQARWQAIAKVPYLPRGDQWVQAKQTQGRQLVRRASG